MSHSKITKRGYSFYLEQWFPGGKKYINVCKLCGQRGYSPVIEQAGFCDDPHHRAVYTELVKTLRRLPLDEAGRCEMCANAMDGGQDARKAGGNNDDL